MSQCSLFQPRVYPLISRDELSTMIVFERITKDWVRSVHRHTSEQKKGKHYVLFRNGSQKKVEGLTELKYYLKQQKEDVLFLDDIKFKNDKDEDIVSNKVGANKIAKQLALQWIKENTN